MNLFGRKYHFQSSVYCCLLNTTWLSISNHKCRLSSHSEKACNEQVMAQDIENNKIQSHPLNYLLAVDQTIPSHLN